MGKFLQLGDDAIKIFVNAKGRSDKASPRLKELINYLECGTPTGSLSGKIDNEVNYARKNKEWRMQFMTYQQEIKFAAARAAEAAREEALAEGMAEGKSLGFQEVTISALHKLLAKFSPEEILEMGFTEDEIKAAQNS